MPKLILSSRYLRAAPPGHLSNYVRYISTRDGVEKIDESKKHLPATSAQKKFIEEMIRDIPSAKDMLEYTDFLVHPTMGNATELISRVMEEHVDLIAEKANYVDYIANRPRVERVGEHGLFTDAGKPVVLSKVQQEVAEHQGVIWTHVISLRREDAARLGYDHADQWMALLRSKRAMFSKHMKIDSKNLRWYAAFHNEGHHPHVHMIVYSAKEKDGYLTKESIEAMRSELSHDIFRQDFANIYEEQKQSRADLKEGTEEVLRELITAIENGTLYSSVIEEKMLQLSERLQKTTGKKVYGYLKRDVKDLIDSILDELQKEKRISELYQTWGRWQNEIYLMYNNQTPELPPLSKNPKLKSLKNMVIAEALQLGSHHISLEEEFNLEVPETVTDMEPEIPEVLEVSEIADDVRTPEEADSSKNPAFPQVNIPRNIRLHADWTARYKEARAYFYGSIWEKKDGTKIKLEQNLEKASVLLQQEAETGSALAMYDLGRMYEQGLGIEADEAAAQQWYKQALASFQSAAVTVPEKRCPYLWYRIGKMYAAGQGTEQNFTLAAAHFADAVKYKHMYAAYSLAGLYYRGNGVEQNYETAFQLYNQSARKGNPYAQYEMAKMLRDGIGTEADPEQAEQCFRMAFHGFQSLEKDSHDDKLQYRLGQMLHTGTGTEQDDEAAARYWEKAAKLKNSNAQYALGKLWLENGTGDSEQVVKWIRKAAEAGKTDARYMLGKLYLEGTYVEKNIERAVQLFRQSAEQGHEYAQYRLGKLYLIGEAVSKDIEQAISYFEQSVEQGNQYAQYILGKLYLCGRDVPRDKEKAIPYLQASAAQGNIYAQFFLDHLDSFRDPSVFFCATNLMRQLVNLIQEDTGYKNSGDIRHQIDQKRRRKLLEKRRAQGQKGNIIETQQIPY